MQRKIALVSNCIYDELHVAYDLDWSSGKTVTILCHDIKNRGSGPSRGGCLFICNHSIKNSLLIYIWPLSNSNIHCVSKETLLYILPLVNNQMNIIIKIICPRKFQQTDRVQLAAPVQLQHEDHLQVTDGGWDVWLNHAIVQTICGFRNISLQSHWDEDPLGSSNHCYMRDNLALMRL